MSHLALRDETFAGSMATSRYQDVRSRESERIRTRRDHSLFARSVCNNGRTQERVTLFNSLSKENANSDFERLCS